MEATNFVKCWKKKQLKDYRWSWRREYETKQTRVCPVRCLDSMFHSSLITWLTIHFVNAITVNNPSWTEHGCWEWNSEVYRRWQLIVCMKHHYTVTKLIITLSRTTDADINNCRYVVSEGFPGRTPDTDIWHTVWSNSILVHKQAPHEGSRHDIQLN